MATHKRKCYIYQDNYTEDAYIAPLVETKGNGDAVEVHGGVRFTYKPMTVMEQVKYNTSDKDTDAEWHKKKAAMLADRVTAWNLTDSADKPLPIRADVMLRLIPALFTRMVAIVWGTSETDIDPNWSEAKQAAETETIMEAKAAGLSPGVAKEVDDEKNSAAG